MKCSKCGFENKINSKYCSNCGFDLESNQLKKNTKGYLVGLIITIVYAVFSLGTICVFLLFGTIFSQLMPFTVVDLLFYLAPYIIAWIGLSIFLIRFFTKKMK